MFGMARPFDRLGRRLGMGGRRPVIVRAADHPRRRGDAGRVVPHVDGAVAFDRSGRAVPIGAVERHRMSVPS